MLKLSKVKVLIKQQNDPSQCILLCYYYWCITMYERFYDVMLLICPTLHAVDSESKNIMHHICIHTYVLNVKPWAPPTTDNVVKQPFVSLKNSALLPNNAYDRSKKDVVVRNLFWNESTQHNPTLYIHVLATVLSGQKSGNVFQ